MESYTINIAIKNVAIMPRRKGPSNAWYELSWRSSKGCPRGGSTKRRTAKEWQEEWGRETEGNSLIIEAKTGRTLVMCLAMCCPGEGVQYSGEVELSTSKIIDTKKASNDPRSVIHTSFPLPTATAEAQLYISWYKHGSAIVQPMSSASHLTTASLIVESSLDNKTDEDVDIRSIKQPSYSSMMETFVPMMKLLPNSLLGISDKQNLPNTLLRIESAYNLEMQLPIYDGEYYLISNLIFESFLKQTDYSICRDLLSIASSPESLLAVLSNNGFLSGDNADISHSLPQWLEDISIQMCSKFDLICDSKKNQKDSEENRASAYRILRIALHRYVYSKVFVALRRPPLAAGSWLKTLQKARSRDQVLRQRLVELQNECQGDLKKWGFDEAVNPKSLSTAIDQLRKLKGCSIPPYDCVLAVMKAGVILTHELEKVSKTAVGADVFFPIFAWCVAQASLQDAVECVCSIESFLVSKPSAAILLSSEMEYHATCLAAALSHLEGDDDQGDECSSDSWSDDDMGGASPVRGSDGAWKSWHKARKDQIIRDKTNNTWLSSFTSMSWKSPKLRGTRRGWYWRYGLSHKIKLNPSSYICFLSKEYGPSELSDRLDRSASSRKLLSIDLERILTGFGPAIAAQKEQLLPDLRDLLTAFIQYRPDLGYVQGMGYIGLMFILHSDTIEEAFIGFCAVIQCPILLSFYNFDTVEMEIQFRAFDKLFSKASPSFANYLSKLGIATKTFLFDWWMTLFIRQFDYNLIAAPLWNLYVGSGCQPHVLHGISIGILDFLGNELITKSEETILITLSQLKSATLNASELLKGVQNQRISKAAYWDAIAEVRKEDPKLLRANPCDSRYQDRQMAVSKPIIDTAAVKIAEWFSTQPYPSDLGEVPTLRDWVWDYSKHSLSSKWSLLLKYAERSPYCSVLIRSVDYSEWVHALLSNWAETDTEYISLHSVRSEGLLFTHQVTDRIRKQYSDHPIISNVLSRINPIHCSNTKGWTPASYLSICTGPIWIASKSTSDILELTIPYRSVDPYTVEQIPDVVEKRISRSTSPLRSVSITSKHNTSGQPNTTTEELSIDIIVWCSDTAANPGRVTEVHITKPDGNTLFVIPTKIHTNVTGGIANQISPTERIRVLIPTDISICVSIVVKTIQQFDGSNEIIGQISPVTFTGETKHSAWHPLVSATSGEGIGKVKLNITSGKTNAKEELKRREQQTRVRIGQLMSDLPETIIIAVLRFIEPSEIVVGIQLCNTHWKKVIFDVFTSTASLQELFCTTTSNIVEILLLSLCHSTLLFHSLLLCANSSGRQQRRKAAHAMSELLHTNLDIRTLLDFDDVVNGLKEFMAMAATEVLTTPVIPALNLTNITVSSICDDDESLLKHDSPRRSSCLLLSLDICKVLLTSQYSITGSAIAVRHISILFLQQFSSFELLKIITKLTDDSCNRLNQILIECGILSGCLRICKDQTMSPSNLLLLIKPAIRFALIIEGFKTFSNDTHRCQDDLRHQKSYFNTVRYTLSTVLVTLCESVVLDENDDDGNKLISEELLSSLTGFINETISVRSWGVLSKFSLFENYNRISCVLVDKLLLVNQTQCQTPLNISEMFYRVPVTVCISHQLAILMCSYSNKDDIGKALFSFIENCLCDSDIPVHSSIRNFISSLFDSFLEDSSPEIWCNLLRQITQMCLGVGVSHDGVILVLSSIQSSLMNFPSKTDIHISLKQVLVDLTLIHRLVEDELNQKIIFNFMKTLGQHCLSSFCAVLMEMSMVHHEK